jgi:HEAT repeat protein
MSVTMQDVRDMLDAFEPDYDAGRTLGPDAVPHLATLARSADALLAAKAVHLASMIGTDAGVAVLRTALGSRSPVVRLQVASGARHLAPTQAATLLPRLLDDAEANVRKFALRSTQKLFTAGTMPEAVRARVAALRETDPEPFVRALATSLTAKPR